MELMSKGLLMSSSWVATSTGSNLCLGVGSGTVYSADVFTPLAQYACPDLSWSVKWNWNITDAANGYYTATDAATGMYCLDVEGQGTANGSAFGVFSCNSATNQQVKIVAVKGGYNIKPVHALSSDMCIDVNSASSDIGTLVQLWECNGTPAQVFNFVIYN